MTYTENRTLYITLKKTAVVNVVSFKYTRSPFKTKYIKWYDYYITVQFVMLIKRFNQG